MTKRLLFIILGLLLIVSDAKRYLAGNHTAATCSSTDVQTQFDAATEAGAVVIIPAGTCHYSSPVAWNPPANAIVHGAGVGLTIIIDDYANSNALFSIGTNASGTFRMYGMTVRGGNVTSVDNAKYNGLILIGGNSAQLRVDDMLFDTSTYNPANNGSVLQFSGCVSGVVDHNTFDNNLGQINNQIRDYNGGTCFSDPLGVGDQTWSRATSLGTSNFIYAEDNVFNAGAGNDCTNAGRYVFRFNVFNSTAGAPTLQTHPTGGSLRHRGCRAWEIYANQYLAVDVNYISDANWISSGTGLIWGNYAPSSSVGGGTGYKYFISLHEMRYDNASYTQDPTPDGWGWCSNHQSGTGSLWDQTTTGGHLCLDQPGAGIGDLLSLDFPDTINLSTGTIHWPNQVQEPIYEWLDAWTQVPSNPGALLAIYDPKFTDTVDYYLGTGSTSVTAGVGNGARSSRPSTCVAGVAYWSSNIGSWNAGSNSFYTGQGVLDLCTATNTWTNNWYVPYTYPHPLVTGSTSDTGNRMRYRR